MSIAPLVSVIVNNYNYGRYLPAAVDSALSQTYPNTEVMLVDDGSTDGSREIIAGYRNRVLPILKDNGGQNSAFNAAYAACHGDIILFLDADDLLDRDVVARVVERFREPGVMKVQWPLREIGPAGDPTGGIQPREPLEEGNLREVVLRLGPHSYNAAPTSGNAWSRQFLDQVFPLAEVEKQFRIGSANADTHLSTLVPLFGTVRNLARPHGCYRVHDASDYSTLGFRERLRRNAWSFEYYSSVLEAACRKRGIPAYAAGWKRRSWFYRVNSALEQVLEEVPAGESFILIDEDCWGTPAVMEERHRIPFLERNGHFWGAPEDDAAAIGELERQRQAGARFAVVGWPAFWWLDHYRGFSTHLRGSARCRVEDDRLLLFDLTGGA